MGLFFYNQKGSIISIEDLPTTEIIEPFLPWDSFLYFVKKTDTFLKFVFYTKNEKKGELL
ncbi:hypothetical protein Y021_04545 [Streptococcus thermophilus 1F8CT]|nr:hypothetical protein Y021_04545 [Streptococcus thermophilus 1F8CT]